MEWKVEWRLERAESECGEWRGTVERKVVDCSVECEEWSGEFSGCNKEWSGGQKMESGERSVKNGEESGRVESGEEGEAESRV